MSQSSLRNIDLNLLPLLQALLEEKSVTRAANRIHLSQPAMSRALERLREHFSDGLLVRSQGKYQLTSRGTELASELLLLLPRIEELWGGGGFSPGKTTARVRIALTDNGANLILPSLIQEVQRAASGLRIDVVSWHEGSYGELSTGTVDLVFSPLAPPPPLLAEVLFDEHFVCLVDQNHSFNGRELSLEQYLDYRHINIETQPGQLTFVDRPLAELGLRRKISLQVPYFIPAVRALLNTELVATVPSALIPSMLKRYPVRLLRAPPQLPSFHYLIVWHPRLDQEPLHQWFRQTVRDACLRGRRLPI